ncbi:MAG: hypothetical protein EOP53_14155 [Sphingobacteriales bacterium]|nr:MAG: hypothetical protein EOP53_14155 [Sphingobacteriales bacterium]
MPEDTELYFWKKNPNRDDALELVYSFLRNLGLHNDKEAAKLISVKDMGFFTKALHDSLLQYLDLVIEDEEWEEYESKNLAYEVDDPANLDEDLTMPQFSGKTFELEKGEELSVQIGLHGRVTPIRLHFAVAEADALYFLRLQRITAK